MECGVVRGGRGGACVEGCLMTKISKQTDSNWPTCT